MSTIWANNGQRGGGGRRRERKNWDRFFSVLPSFQRFDASLVMWGRGRGLTSTFEAGFIILQSYIYGRWKKEWIMLVLIVWRSRIAWQRRKRIFFKKKLVKINKSCAAFWWNCAYFLFLGVVWRWESRKGNERYKGGALVWAIFGHASLWDCVTNEREVFLGVELFLLLPG